MRVNGKTIRLMDMGNTCTLMEQLMKVSGKKTSNMVMVVRPGLTQPSTRAITSKARKMARADSDGQTVVPTKVSSRTTILMEEGSTSGLTRESMMACG